MQRIKGWEQRLYAVTVQAMGAPHAWGQNDCVTFVADAVRELTGVDLGDGLRGTYDSPLGALRVMHKLGANNVGDLAALYMPEVSPSQARRGDIILASDPHDFLAVCVGRTAVGPSAHGMLHIPMEQAVRAFKVGE
jgi:cell wall-associated NlpC family hydrolase